MGIGWYLYKYEQEQAGRPKHYKTWLFSISRTAYRAKSGRAQNAGAVEQNFISPQQEAQNWYVSRLLDSICCWQVKEMRCSSIYLVFEPWMYKKQTSVSFPVSFPTPLRALCVYVGLHTMSAQSHGRRREDMEIHLLLVRSFSFLPDNVMTV